MLRLPRSSTLCYPVPYHAHCVHASQEAAELLLGLVRVECPDLPQPLDPGLVWGAAQEVAGVSWHSSLDPLPSASAAGLAQQH